MAVIGAVLICAILWEVFNDLFQPSGSGALSDWIGRTTFNLLRRVPKMLPLAGAATLVAVIAVWVAALVLGFTLLYLDSFPESFRTSTGAEPSNLHPFASTLYFSFETLITLGYGDLVPSAFSIRVLSSVQGLLGFGLLTASVSFIVLLYPALARMRALARSVAHIVAAEQHTGLSAATAPSDTRLTALAAAVTRARIDLIHFPLVYYFVTSDEAASIATWTRVLRRLAVEASRPDQPAPIRLTAATLDAALDDLAAILASRFLHRAPAHEPDAVFDAFAADQGVRRRSAAGL
jgi:hypothetical protein